MGFGGVGAGVGPGVAKVGENPDPNGAGVGGAPTGAFELKVGVEGKAGAEVLPVLATGAVAVTGEEVLPVAPPCVALGAALGPSDPNPDGALEGLSPAATLLLEGELEAPTATLLLVPVADGEADPPKP